MQLEQPIPPNNPGGDNQYDFIMNGKQAPKKSILPSGNSRKQRIILIVGGALAFFAIFAIVLALIFSSGGEDTKALLGLAQTQTEITRVSADGTTKARSAATQNFTQTVTTTMTTAQQQTIEVLAKKTKVDEKKLVLGRSTKTDTALTSAQQAGRYDEELTATLTKALASYKTEISQAATKTTTKSQKELLQKLYTQVEALIKNQPTSS